MAEGADLEIIFIIRRGQVNDQIPVVLQLRAPKITAVLISAYTAA